MRWLLIAFAIVLMSNGYASSQKAGDDKSIAHKNQESKQKEKAAKEKFSPIEKPKTDEVNPASKKPNSRPEEKLNVERKLVEYTGELSTFTMWLVIVTADLAGITGGLVWMACRQERHTKTIERAYVQMSHVTSDKNPGLQIFDEARAKYAAYINIKNYGNTPARVTKVFMTHRILPRNQALPNDPEYSKIEGEIAEEPIEAFLVKNGDFTYYFPFLISPEDVAFLNEGERVLFIYGFVDYMDQFDRSYRGGYARRYRPNLEINNLVFVPHPKYNYDEEQKN